MPANLTHNDKLTLIGMCKFIINADGEVTDSELESMETVAREIGFEDYTKIFDEVDEKIFTIDDLKIQIDNMAESENKTRILKLAIQISRSDANIQDDEIDILRYAADSWDIDISRIMNN